MKYDRNDFSPPLDPGIERAVVVLHNHGVKTIQSCQGGKGHSSPEPIVQFWGGKGEGLRALGIAVIHGMPVSELRQIWSVSEGDIIDRTFWELVFYEQVPLYNSELNAPSFKE